ncbi:MAG: DUF2520 domain-containing protein [Pseudopedobacter saltans]|uniref:DUF2520 domain-containing protein n=1 Tax=Pseudopedobacter saltans TaxID=151895 RepID=A0A2W5GTH8_9SPHI|nr:MAG: DUF2520 domain-containing protein [Pseudopedobacter saltans]
MGIVIIGSGNVASIFACRLFENNIKIEQIVARNPVSGNALAGQLNAVFIQDISNVKTDADVYLITVQDDFLPMVADSLRGKISEKALVLHTTGSASIKVLEHISSQYGVLYPLQSLRKENVNSIEIPLFLDANNNSSFEKLENFAKNISPIIAFADDQQRIRLHIAAVFVSNFPNYLYVLAESFCKNHNIEFSNLLPLMKETTNRISFFSPKDIQTGPAARGDLGTIEKHTSILEKENPELLKVYEFLTNGILDTFLGKK